MFSNFMYSQNISPFSQLKIPDSLYMKLEEFYIEERGYVKSHINVYNVVNKGNPIFEYGVYSFSLTGPHFPRRIFIFHNNRISIFKSEGAFNSIGVLKEFIECIKILKISEVDRIIYMLLAIIWRKSWGKLMVLMYRSISSIKWSSGKCLRLSSAKC